MNNGENDSSRNTEPDEVSRAVTREGSRQNVVASDDDALGFTYHIIGTHFSTFSYIDTKLQALLAISSVLLGGATFVYTSFEVDNIVAQSILWAAVILLVFSIILCIWHVTPKLDSGVGNNKNPRSAIGTTPLSKEDYHSKICGLSKEDMLKFNCYQISGLSRINTSGGKALFYSSMCIGISVLLFAFALFFNGIPQSKKVSEKQQSNHPIVIINQTEKECVNE